MRLIHTGDIHLDLSYADSALAPGFGHRRRQGLRDVFDAIIDRARQWPADAVLVAGDLFEQDRITRETVAFLRAAFERLAPVPVFIAPGNCDPFVASSPYATEPWPRNVYIFDRPAWSSHQLRDVPLTVHGFAFDGPEPSANPFGTLTVPRDGRVHVALAHASELAHLPADKAAHCPFYAQDAATPGLHYLALGHVHRVTRIGGDYATVMYYAGAPEGHSHHETGPRHYLEVEIALEDNAAPGVHVRPVPSSRCIWESHTVDCTAMESGDDLNAALQTVLEDPERPQVLRVVFTGACGEAVRSALAIARESLSDQFEQLEVIDQTELPEDYEALAREDTSLGAFAARMNAEIRDTTDPARHTMLLRARAVGVAAYRGQSLPAHGMEGPLP